MEVFREEFALLKLRRTYQGYYVVIPAIDSEEKLFVFLDWNLRVWDSIICKEFPSREQARPLIQRVDYALWDNMEVPNRRLPTGAAYVAYYYTDGIEIVLYTDIDSETHDSIMPETMFYFRSAHGARCVLYTLINGHDVPIILDIDRQNAAPSVWDRVASYSAIIRAGLLMALLFVFFNWVSLRKAYKELKSIDQSVEIKRYKRKWIILYFTNIPLFLLSFWFSLTIGYPATLFAAFIYLIIIILIEKKQRMKLMQNQIAKETK